MSTTIESFLLKASLAINNAIQVEAIASELSNFGYTIEVLQHGKALLEHAQHAHELQKKEYGEQYQATENLEQQRLHAAKTYMLDLKLARIALADNTAAQGALGLKGRRKKKSEWIPCSGCHVLQQLISTRYLAIRATNS